MSPANSAPTPARISLFVGKGGVGKSTLASCHRGQRRKRGAAGAGGVHRPGALAGRRAGRRRSRRAVAANRFGCSPSERGGRGGGGFLDALALDTLALLEARWRDVVDTLDRRFPDSELSTIAPEELSALPGIQEVLGLHAVGELAALRAVGPHRRRLRLDRRRAADADLARHLRAVCRARVAAPSQAVRRRRRRPVGGGGGTAGAHQRQRRAARRAADRRRAGQRAPGADPRAGGRGRGGPDAGFAGADGRPRRGADRQPGSGCKTSPTNTATCRSTRRSTGTPNASPNSARFSTSSTPPSVRWRWC